MSHIWWTVSRGGSWFVRLILMFLKRTLQELPHLPAGAWRWWKGLKPNEFKVSELNGKQKIVEKILFFSPCPSLHGSSNSWQQLADNLLINVLSVMKQFIKHLICSLRLLPRLTRLMKFRKWRGNTNGEAAEMSWGNQRVDCQVFTLNFLLISLPLIRFVTHIMFGF